MSCEIPYPVAYCLNALNEAGFSAWVVGGAVRDLLLGRPIHDYDMTTNARPQQILEVFQNDHVIPTGIKHGTITVMKDHLPIEITTYRHDGNYEDHRHPSAVTFTDQLEEDCARRDFTINAMAFHPYEGIVDFFHGTQDLQNHIIRAVGDPNKRFDEDALRILRAIRFASQLQFAIEEQTEEALFACKDGLAYVSKERIRQEWDKILVSETPGSYLNRYQTILSIAIPRFDEIDEDRMNQLDHAPNNLYIRLALLFTSDIVKEVMNDLRYDHHTLHIVERLLSIDNMPYHSRIDLRFLLASCDVDVALISSYLATIHQDVDQMQTHHLLRDIKTNDCISTKQLAINGHDLVDYGIPAEQRQTVLTDLLYRVMDESLENQRECLLAQLSRYQ